MSAICDAHKKKGDAEQLYNPGEDRKSSQLEKRCSRENQHPAEGCLRLPIEQLQRKYWNEEYVPERLGPQAPRLSSPGERERNAVMANRVGVQYVAVLFGLKVPLTHNPFK